MREKLRERGREREKERGREICLLFPIVIIIIIVTYHLIALFYTAL